ncbi:ParA family protein [Noviherbaspirillum pedocola]|uniref:ParA family protein n=1 Tax=Noviherbaspirillum pedocola TaxID=2801341 RepID=A0A934W9W3_9BURK|nr:ParA family protein [Noviherbaspirillum pedocola]MBK4738763.1 ParA family protein [Noviherbaspirillum pedocola]
MRSTFALLDDCQYRLKAAAALLSVSENTLRTYVKDSGIEIKRATADNPNSPAVRIFTLDNIFQLAAWRRKQGLIKPLSATPICIAVELIKGGTGKSTTTAEIGIQLQLSGYRVLMIDLDVQANLTQLMGYESDLEDGEAATNDLNSDAIVHGTFAEVVKPYLENSRPGANKMDDISHYIKWPFGADGPALIPSDTFLGDLEHAIVATRDTRELVFRSFFRASTEGKIPGLNVKDFDFVLFDCPPSISFVASNAIAVSDYIIAPVKMDSFGVKGVSRLVGEINYIQSKSGQQPELIILPTHYSSNVSRVARMSQKLQTYKDNLPDMSISSSELFPKSQEYYMPLTLQQPTSAPVKEYRKFTDFLLQKIGAKEYAAAKEAAAKEAAAARSVAA